MKTTRLERKQASSLANGGKKRQVLPAVHGNRVIACLLLLLLDSRNQVDHPFSFCRNPNFWPPVEMELPNKPALLLLVTLRAGKNTRFIQLLLQNGNTLHSLNVSSVKFCSAVVEGTICSLVRNILVLQTWQFCF